MVALTWFSHFLWGPSLYHRGENKAAHHWCLPKYGLLINPSWPAAFWKYLSRERAEGEETGLIVWLVVVLTLWPSVKGPISAMIIRSMFLWTEAIIQQIKGKLLWMLPWRKDISISFIQDFEWPPLAVRNKEMFSTSEWTLLILLGRQKGQKRATESSLRR